MGQHAFKFSLQPALEHALFEQDSVTISLKNAKSEVSSQEEVISDILRQRAAEMQLLAGNTDNPTSKPITHPSAQDLIDSSRFLESLRQRQERERQVLSRLLARVREWEEELKEKSSLVESLKKLKEEEATEFSAQQRRLEEAEIDEQATNLFNRQRREKRP